MNLITLDKILIIIVGAVAVIAVAVLVIAIIMIVTWLKGTLL